MEPIFSVAYLVAVIFLGVRLVRGADNGQRKLFGIAALVLGCGDAFHLVPRIYGLLTDTMAASTAALGFGKLVTSITMTVFYVLLYHVWCMRYQKPARGALTWAVYALAAIRIALCLFPQNRWLDADAPLIWGIYRNIPFLLLGVLMMGIWHHEAQRAKDAFFRWAWLAVLLSFAFYTPVVLWADTIPALGMLMIPKTICYVWLVWMGYRAYITAR